MCSKIISYCLLFGIISSSDQFSTDGETCISIEPNRQYRLDCPGNNSLYIKQAWFDGKKRCHFRISSTSRLSNTKIDYSNGLNGCKVSFFTFLNKYSYFNILFQCKGGYNTPGYHSRELGHSTEIVKSPTSRGEYKTPGYHSRELGHSTEIVKSPTSRGGYNTPGYHSRELGHSTEIVKSPTSRDGSITPGDDTTTQFHSGPNYAFVVGVIVGVVLITCIIVGVCLLRRRNASSNAQRPSKRKGMTKSNPTHDPAHGQTESEKNQRAYLMNSPDAIHMSASHSVNLDNTTNESNSYSHIRNTEDDSDVTYDHTVRNAVHGICDGDYGIAQRRITADDYDVSGNFRQSLSNTADPVYN